MTIRSYSGLMILEGVFDNIPTTNPTVNSLALQIFSPRVLIEEEDCGTLLGKKISLNYDSVGLVELSTGLPFSPERVELLLSQGVYTTFVRSINTCVSKNGVCQKCYSAGRQKESIPPIGSSQIISPEYVSMVEVNSAAPGTTTLSIGQIQEYYDRAYVYIDEALQSEDSYSLTDSELILNTPLEDYHQVTIKFAVITRAPFLSWLASTYSGSLLGLKEMISPPLPIRKRLLTSLIPQSMVDLLAEEATSLPEVSEDCVSYLPLIKDPLEKALFTISLFGVYLNVV